MNKKMREIMNIGFEVPQPRGKKEFLRKLNMPKATCLEALIYQIGYVRKRIWCLSLAGVIIVAWLLKLHGESEILNPKIPILWMVSAFIPFVVLLTITELAKSGLHGMEELELSCRYSLQQIIIARVLILGFANLILLLALFVLLSWGQGAGLIRIGLVLFIPYFLTCGTCIFVMNHIRGREGIFGCAVMAFLVSMISIFLQGNMEWLFTTPYYGMWTMVCVLSMIFLTFQMRLFIKAKEDYKWNSLLID